MPQFIPSDFSSVRELSTASIHDAVLAIGVFDGVHLGHRKLLRELLRLSGELDAVPVVMTFSPHPRTLFRQDSPVKLLYPEEERSRLLCEAGAKAVVTVPFTREFAGLEPEQFLEQTLLSGPVRIKGICVGKHWRFGKHAAGDCTCLEKISREKGFVFSAVDELCMEDSRTVSSTLIREAVAAGDLRKAAEMLGRTYSLYGEIVRGYQVASGDLSTPTANLQICSGVLPPFGVYAARAQLSCEEKEYPAAVNIGISPTFRERYGEIAPRIEVHLLNDFHKNIYGQSMRLTLEGFIRQERTFSGPEELKQQIRQDIALIHALLERKA